MTVNQQEIAVQVVRILLRKSPAEAIRIVRKLSDEELAEVISITAYLRELRDQLVQIVGN